MATGRTVSKWIRFLVDDSGGTPREIPINTVSPVGFAYDENDLTAWQDAVKGYLTGHPDAPIDIGGPFDNSAAVAVAASGAAPALSGSHTVLHDQRADLRHPAGAGGDVRIRGYWTTGR